MSTLHALAAVLAMTDVDVELPMNGPAWNLGLVLRLDLVRHDGPAAGAASGSGASSTSSITGGTTRKAFFP